MAAVVDSVAAVPSTVQTRLDNFKTYEKNIYTPLMAEVNKEQAPMWEAAVRVERVKARAEFGQEVFACLNEEQRAIAADNYRFFKGEGDCKGQVMPSATGLKQEHDFSVALLEEQRKVRGQVSSLIARLEDAVTSYDTDLDGLRRNASLESDVVSPVFEKAQNQRQELEISRVVFATILGRLDVRSGDASRRIATQYNGMGGTDGYVQPTLRSGYLKPQTFSRKATAAPAISAPVPASDSAALSPAPAAAEKADESGEESSED